MRKSLIIASAIVLLIFTVQALGAKPKYKSKSKPKPKPVTSFSFYVGTYSLGQDGKPLADSEGIYRFSLTTATGKLTNLGLATKSENPSFLTYSSDGKTILAVNEVKDENAQNTGYLESFSIDYKTNELKLISKVATGGAHPCYVATNNLGDVLVANYTGGSVSLFHLSYLGFLTDYLDIQKHVGSGPNSARQAGPHAHSAYFEPNSNRIFVADLGIDQVKVYNLKQGESKLTSTDNSINVSPGAGPRHMAFHPTLKLVYVVNELSSSVATVKRNKDGSFTQLEEVSALPVGSDKPNSCADIHVTKDGRFLYVSNRGFNSIAEFSIDSQSGKLTQIGQQPCGGETPRNFALSPDENFIVVANQNSKDIVCFSRNAKDGKLQYKDKIKGPKAVCILFCK